MASHAVKFKEELKPGEKVPLCFDECAKIMFANPKHMEPLILLLSKVLRVEYDELVDKVELAPTTSRNNIIGAKKTDRDIVVYIKEDIKGKIVIEVNMSESYYEAITNKSLYYMFETAGSGLKESENYDKIEPTFLICFNTFYVDNIHKKIFDEYYFRNDEGYILTTKEKIIEINIAACYQSWYNGTYKALTNIYEKDLLLLGAAMYTKEIKEFNKCIEEIMISRDIKNIVEEVSERMNENEELKVRYYDFLEETRRLNDSIISDEKRKSRHEGLQEGIEQTKKEIVLNMYNKKYDLSIIGDATNLSINEINEIINH
ncbi:MAG: PD-(D/E)XK nuclease family transposase [Bacilli bacterium]|nr:PD-(D/E)XK nuclease family transposase [Bacilli bacterium]